MCRVSSNTVCLCSWPFIFHELECLYLCLFYQCLSLCVCQFLSVTPAVFLPIQFMSICLPVSAFLPRITIYYICLSVYTLQHYVSFYVYNLAFNNFCISVFLHLSHRTYSVCHLYSKCVRILVCTDLHSGIP